MTKGAGFFEPGRFDSRMAFMTRQRACAVMLMWLVCSYASVWSDEIVRPTAAPPDVKPPVTAIAFAPDGRSVVVGSQAGIELRSWPALEPVRRIATELTNVHDLAFSPDGRFLAAAGGEPAESGSVEMFRWPDLDLVHRVTSHEDLVYAVAWRSDSAVFATASADRMVGIHDAATGKTVRMLEGHSRGVLAALYLPGDVGLLTAGIDETVRLWDSEAGSPVRALPNHTRPVHGLALQPGDDGRTLPLVASVSDDRTVRLWQPTIGRLVRFVRLESAPQAVAWTAGRQALVVVCKDGRLRTINADTAQVIEDLPATEGPAYSLAVARDGSVAVGGRNGQLRRVTLRPIAP